MILCMILYVENVENFMITHFADLIIKNGAIKESMIRA